MQTTTTMASEATGDTVFIQNRLEEVQALAGLFGFFSRCIEAEADTALLGLVRGELRSTLAEFGVKFDEEFYHAPTEKLVELLAEEFTGLFVAPGCVNPYASVAETGCLFKEPADKAMEAYRQAGWDYQNRLSGEFPDHIGTMLGFYANLAGAEAAALSTGDIPLADEHKQRRVTFFLDLLAEWAPGWCRRAADAALQPFYRQILTMVEQALWLELEQLVDRRRLRELVELNRREPKRLDYDADFRKASGL